MLDPDRAAPPVSAKAWQRTIRERNEIDDPRPALADLASCRVEAISREEAKGIILRYEWLGTMGAVSKAFYGLRGADGELLGTVTFGTTGSAQSRHICRRKECADGNCLKDNTCPYIPQTICLERGACVHFAPPNAASFLISQATKMAADDHGWRIFYAYADMEAGEIGTVYQACNWLYLGQGIGRGKKHPLRQDWMIPEEGNRIIASRSLRARKPKVTIKEAFERGWTPIYRHAKHKYIHFEGNKTERKALRAALYYPPQPYPKREEGAGQ